MNIFRVKGLVSLPLYAHALYGCIFFHLKGTVVMLFGLDSMISEQKAATSGATVRQ